MKTIDITYPKLKSKQKKWLKDWWKKNINTFLYAIENEDIQKEIKDYRKRWLTDEIGSSPETLEPILKRIFLKDSENGRKIDDIKYHGCPVKRVGDDYYVIMTNKETGRITEWKLGNPFMIFDDDIFLKPETKMRLIKMLANPHENGWLFEPRYLINEETMVYPTSHNLISTMHQLHFLKPLDIHLLGKYNMDYFIFWPMFFYYAITDDVDYVLKNVGFLHYPIKLFLVRDGEHQVLQFRLYGDCNFNEIFNFIKDNKKKLGKLNKLMGINTISSGSLRDYHFYKEKQDSKNTIDLIEKLKFKEFIKINNNKKHSCYDDYLKEAVIKDNSYRLNTNKTRGVLKKESNQIRTTISQVKKEINSFSDLSKYKNIDEAEKIIDSINKIN